jgi:hypothetical protein
MGIPEDERIILKLVLEGYNGYSWTGFIRRVVDSCEHSNELSGSIKWWEFHEWLSDWRLIMKDRPHGVS